MSQFDSFAPLRRSDETDANRGYALSFDEEIQQFHPSTEQLSFTKPLRSATPAPTTQSLVTALRSTIQPRTTTLTRPVVIPGAKKTVQLQREQISVAQARRFHPKLRLSIVLGTILFVLCTVLFTLSPLSDAQGQGAFFPGVAKWIKTQQYSWIISSHNMTLQNTNNGATTTNNPVAAAGAAPPPMNLPKSQYVAIAQQDAINAGISPDYFVRQINQESGFNPNAYSPAGAIGIAQFIPSTAAGLGINPYEPIQSLRAAANLMGSYARQYGGNYAKALAAYNAGGGTVDYAVNTCGTAWMSCLPGETRNYIRVIIGI